MRGTPDAHELTTCVGGIIPAYAGNTTNFVACQNRSRDHPRICGEHIVNKGEDVTDRGSSPHMRGTRLPCKLLSVGNGIIPAYAGNTTSMSRSRRSPQDHPRICGEHTLSGIAERTGLGSSPHMRGTPQARTAREDRLGIIPAYAGNTKPVSNPPK